MEIPQADIADQKLHSRWSGLGTRIKGVLPFLVVVVACVIMGGVFFTALVLVAAIIMVKEWDALTANSTVFYKTLGYPLTVIPCACLLWLRYRMGGMGMLLVFSLIAIIAATDIGAYFTGKRFGRLKLAPTISPNKTWEGLGGAVLAAIVIAVIILPLDLPIAARIGTGMLIAVLAQLGDILESFVKRRAGVKDSGTLIPGHGGLLDRVDGYLLAAPAFALLVYSYGL